MDSFEFRLLKISPQTAFIKEALRFSVGVIHHIPRVVGGAPTEIGGHKIPPGVRSCEICVKHSLDYFEQTDGRRNELSILAHES